MAEAQRRLALYADAIPVYLYEHRPDQRGGVIVIPRRWTVSYLVGAEGFVEDVRVERSSGEPRVDQVAVALGQHLRFRPALRDGEPRSAWVEMPLALTPQTPRY